jgi:hypothetical protein
VRVPRHRDVLSHRGGLFLVPAAALVVHQLRYTLAYGSRAGAELAAQGHSYLHSLVPWTVLALAVGLGSFLRRVARTLRTEDADRAPRRPAAVLWLGAWCALLVVYATQETLEALLATGHPGGAAGVVGHGGWWAIPASALVALAVTALLVVGRAILCAAAPARTAGRRPLLRVVAPAGVAAAVVRPLARAAAGRAPPLAPATR